MLKRDLVTAIVNKQGMSQVQAEAVVETILKTMADSLYAGERIEIRGFGAFCVRQYDGYQGRNPKTGQTIPVKAKRGIHFRTSQELRVRVNGPGVTEAPAPGSAAGPVGEADLPVEGDKRP